jgi:cell wall-associated NlpC family hydrolase
LAGATAIASAIVVFPRPVFATTLTQARAQAAQIAAQLATDQNQFGVLNDAYNLAVEQNTALNTQITLTETQLAADRTQLASDQSTLRTEAIIAYTNGNTTGLNTLFAGTGEQASIASEYRTVATGSLQTTLDALHQAETRLTTTQNTLTTEETASHQAVLTAQNDKQQAATLVTQQQTLLSHQNAQITALVAQQQAATQQAAQKTAVTQLGPTAIHTTPPPPGTGTSTAIAAAESQLGVPYVWGGETPGKGFDCSGLVQWAERQAGINLPRTAAAQYDAITHIPLTAIQPGDLLFWATDGAIFHVAIYIGNGDVIQAPETGETVSIAPIWSTDLYAAGRP